MLKPGPGTRGFIFATAYAVLALAIRHAMTGALPPRLLDVFLIGVGVTTYFFSWIPAVALLIASLGIVQFTTPATLWPAQRPALQNILSLLVYCSACGAFIVAVERLRRKIAFWRGKADGLRESEQALRESEAFTRSVVYSAVDGIIAIDETGLIRSFNPAAEKLFGHAADEVIGRNVSLLMPAPWGEEHDGCVQRYLTSHKPRIIGIGREVIALRKDGTTFPAELAISEMVLPDRRIFTGIVRDISQRKQAEEALREANTTLRAVIETSPLAICTTDLQGNIKTWNPAAERMFGWTGAELIGHPFPMVPEGKWDEFLAGLDAARRGEVFSGVERRRVNKSGAPVDIAIWNAPLRDREGSVTGVLSVIADVSEQRRLEQQLLQATKMEAIGRLAGGVAHDFNNILTVIAGYAEMIAERAAQDEETSADIGEILKASDHASALTNQLLVFSRHRVSNPESLDLNEIVTHLEKMLRRVIGEDVRLITYAEPGLGAIRADPAQIEQVILNLAVNARDAMPHGGTLLIETAGVELDAAYARTHVGVVPGDYVMLAVSDTGTGMDAETRSRIFEPFFTTKEKGKGTGLGLSTVYGIVKQAGGEIWVYSEPGRGTTFKMYFPHAGVPPAAEVALTTEPVVQGAETVLVVEDEAGVRRLVSNVLAGQGYRILEAPGPLEALRVCEQHPEPIHLLLTDVVMPHMSGRDLADRAAALRPDLRILYMSGYTDNVMVHHGIFEAGAPFIQKPFTPGLLARKVRQVLDGEPGSCN